MTATITIPRETVILDDHYDPPTVDLYPPLVDDPPPVPDRDEPMFSARSILAREGYDGEPSGHRPSEGMTSVYELGADVKRKRVDINPWHVLSAAAAVVPLLLAALAVWAAGAYAAPVSHTPPAAPTTGPTPSPLGLSVVDDSPAAFVAELLDVRGGSAR